MKSILGRNIALTCSVGACLFFGGCHHNSPQIAQVIGSGNGGTVSPPITVTFGTDANKQRAEQEHQGQVQQLQTQIGQLLAHNQQLIQQIQILNDQQAKQNNQQVAALNERLKQNDKVIEQLRRQVQALAARQSSITSSLPSSAPAQPGSTPRPQVTPRQVEAPPSPPDPNFHRIQFARGAISATIQGVANQDNNQPRYVLRALGGQVMSVYVSSKQAIFSIYRGAQEIGRSDILGRWADRLPADGDYVIHVYTNSGADVTYNMTVSISRL